MPDFWIDFCSTACLSSATMLYAQLRGLHKLGIIVLLDVFRYISVEAEHATGWLKTQLCFIFDISILFIARASPMVDGMSPLSGPMPTVGARCFVMTNLTPPITPTSIALQSFSQTVPRALALLSVDPIHHECEHVATKVNYSCRCFLEKFTHN